MNKEKDALTGMVAHDLRSPLGVIQIYSDHLINCFKYHDLCYQSEFLKVINKTSKTMKSLLNDILDISKINSGHLDLCLEEEDYIKIVEEVINFNKILSLEKHIEIILEKAVCIPKIYVDARRIEQVLNNLIGNAVKFSGQDEKISVSVFCKR